MSEITNIINLQRVYLTCFIWNISILSPNIQPFRAYWIEENKTEFNYGVPYLSLPIIEIKFSQPIFNKLKNKYTSIISKLSVIAHCYQTTTIQWLIFLFYKNHSLFVIHFSCVCIGFVNILFLADVCEE